MSRRDIPMLSPHDQTFLFGQMVFVYRNLNKRCWSVRAMTGENKGRILFHATELWLEDAAARVSTSGRNRVLRERQKNVHAGLVGVLTQPRHGSCSLSPISYDPYRFDHFYEVKTLCPWHSGQVVSFEDKSVCAGLTIS
jgi:hypothetical protein